LAEDKPEQLLDYQRQFLNAVITAHSPSPAADGSERELGYSKNPGGDGPRTIYGFPVYSRSDCELPRGVAVMITNGAHAHCESVVFLMHDGSVRGGVRDDRGEWAPVDLPA
jgi:hypothetical protein